MSSSFVRIRQDQREFVASHAGYHVRLPDARLHGSCHVDQHFVSRLMSQRVVDVFKSVEAKVGERDRLMASQGPIPFCCGKFIECQSIPNAREAVYTRKLPLAIM